MPVLGLFEFGVGCSKIGSVVGVVVGDVVDSLSAVDVDDNLSAVLVDYFESDEFIGVVDDLLDVELVGMMVRDGDAVLIPGGTDAIGKSYLREGVVGLVMRL